jgi:GT2 family glycosyltransferase
MVAREFPAVRLVRNADNQGFARASNQAASLARGEYLFFLNNDTVLAPGAIRELFDYLDARPEVGLVGPRLIGGDGQTQTSWRGAPNLKALIHRTLWLRWTGLWAGHYRRYRRAGSRPATARGPSRRC